MIQDPQTIERHPDYPARTTKEQEMPRATEEVKIDQETLKNQVNLTPEQEEALTLQISKELDAEESKEKKSDEEVIPGQEEENKPALTEAEAAAVKEAEAKKEEERLTNAKDDDLSAEDKTKKAEIVKAKETETAKGIETELADYAKEHNITVEEAKADFESIAKIQEKYKGDPKQLAKANLYLQRIYSKTEAEAKALKEAKAAQPVQEVTIEAVEKYIESGKVTLNGKETPKEQVIEAYRQANPDLTDNLDDDKVLKLAAKDYHAFIIKQMENQKTEVSVKAKEKRANIFDSVPEADKKFIPELKPMIEKLSDAQIMDVNFAINDYVTYVKGKKIDEITTRHEQEKKEFGEKEYKRGLEEAKILGEKRPPDGKPPIGGGKVTLNEEQKKRALEMFDQKEITEARAYELYAEILEDEKKTKK